MKARSPLLKNFKANDDSWEGKMHVPFWEGTLHVSIEVENDEPAPEQITMLEAIAAYDKDLRDTLIKKVFSYYRNSIYDAIYAEDENGEDISDLIAPKVTKSAGMWELIDTPRLFIPDQTIRDRPCFVLLFECRWDNEHGLCVLFENWKIKRIGQQGNVLY